MRNQHQQGLDAFYQLCQNVSSATELDELFHTFFTPEELHALSLRVHLIRELLQGERSQREIAKQLNISISKITRGSNQLKSVSNFLKDYMKKELI